MIPRFRVPPPRIPPVIYHRRCKPSLPSSHSQRGVPIASNLLTIPSTFLIPWAVSFISTTRLVEIDGSYDSIPLVSFPFHPLVNISFEGACSPLNGVINMNKVSILSSITRDSMLINFLLLVHLVGSVPQHFLIAC